MLYSEMPMIGGNDMRRFLVLLLITVIAVNVSAAALAAAAPSGQPPVGDHVYALMEELGKRGIIDVSSLSLKGDKRATRWNLVSAIAECLRTLDPGKLDRQDIEALGCLSPSSRASWTPWAPTIRLWMPPPLPLPQPFLILCP